MSEFFVAGGWGMYPTTVFGLLLLAAGLAYASAPGSRFVPLLVTLGGVTFASGLLGCTMGVVRTFRFIAEVPVEERSAVALAGVSESLHDVVLALIFLVLALLAAAVGALRLGLRAQAQPSLGTN